MKKITYFGTISKGVLKVSHRKQFATDLQTFGDCPVVVTIEKKSRKRTLNQNAYLHVLLTIFRDSLNELGNKLTLDDVKELMKYKFLVTDVYDITTGEIIGQRLKGTSELTTTEFNEFIENIIQYAAEKFNFVLPYPNEQLAITLEVAEVRD